MKPPLLLTLGLLLLALQIILFFASTPGLRLPFIMASLLVGGILWYQLHRLLGSKPVSESESAAPPVAAPPAPEPVRPEAELVALVALLQEQGRLIDFIREDLAVASDAQVGAAARVVHAGCRRVLEEAFTIEPIRSEAEGATVELTAGFDAPAHRLLGQVAEEPPYKGKLLHPGWRATAIRLPKVTGTTSARPWPVLAPAEIEVR